MSINPLKHELQAVLSGKSAISHGAFIHTIARYLGPGSPTGPMAQDDQSYKHKETERLITYVEHHHHWVDTINFSNFISEGAEQRVFLKDEKYVYKLNDTIYYASWVNYLHSLLLNNFFFSDTAYQLVGFCRQEGALYAVVKQPFVRATEPTDLSLVKAFMANNGFVNTRNHDYYNSELGIILEDLHDENVLTQRDMLYFIDTVFYVKSQIPGS